jgi:hypothetical protein
VIANKYSGIAVKYKYLGTTVTNQNCGTWSLIIREEHTSRVFENRVLRRIFGFKREEVAGGWRNLHNEELHNLYCSPNIIRVIKLRMRWAVHVARMGEIRNATKFLLEKLKRRDHLDHLGVNGRVWTGFIWLRIGNSGELLRTR